MEFAKALCRLVVYLFFFPLISIPLCGTSFGDVYKRILYMTPGAVQSVPSHYSMVFMGPSRGPGVVSVVDWGHASAVHAQ